MAQPKSATITVPLLPLPAGIIILPGVAHRLPVPPTRADIPALLATIYQQAATPAAPLLNSTNNDSSPRTRINQVPIVCVPYKSPLIGPDGQLLLQDGTHGPFDGSVQDPVKGAVVARTGGINKDEFFAYATSAKIVGFEGSGTGGMSLVVEGTGRVRMGDVTKEAPHYEAQVEPIREDAPVKDPQLRELFALLKMRSAELISVHISSLISRQHASSPIHLANIRRVATIIRASHLRDAGALADLMVSVIDSTYEEKLQLLATLEIKPRVVKAIELIERQVDELKNLLKATTLAAVPIRIVGVTSARPQFGPPAAPGRPPMPVGSGSRWDEGPGKEPSELDELHQKLCHAKLPPDAAKLTAKELRRLQKMAPVNQEYQVISNWLETMAEIPWATVTLDRWDKETLDRARKQLDQDHYGLESVKKRLVEYLAVLRLKQPINDELDAQIKKLEEEVAQGNGSESNPPAAESTTAPTTSGKTLEELRSRRSSDKSPILLLAGPPGVGKTSLAKSVATALGRKFHRISLGGVRDEAEIRGHRRTYVAAMPGILIQALRKVGVANPVILLDEIDKLSSSNHHGDPSAAMLEVLDPEQNHTFTDHYVGTPVDLSKVLFIATANNLETIAAPLLDRLEIITLPGYTTIEKRRIASQHLVPKQIRANGLVESTVTFSTDVVSRIIESYTREAGVRNLEREIGAVCRAKVVEYAEAQDSGDAGRYRPELTVSDIEAILGPERFEEEVAESSNRPGIVTGLVAYSYGGAGSILFIEIAAMPGDGSVQLTGQLGSVLQESVGVALSWVKGHAFDLGLTQDPASNIMQDRSIHVHCPSGAVPKDGPSSGIAQAIALISLFSGKPVPPTLAMTGEISLRGRVMAVGGIKEKLIGALRAGIKTAIVPAQNRRDVADLPEEVKSGITIYHIRHIWEAVQLVWPDWRQAVDHDFARLQSQL